MPLAKVRADVAAGNLVCQPGGPSRHCSTKQG